MHLRSRALALTFGNNVVLPWFPELMGVRFQYFCAWLCQETVLGRVNEGRNWRGLVAWCRPYLGRCPNFHGLKYKKKKGERGEIERRWREGERERKNWEWRVAYVYLHDIHVLFSSRFRFAWLASTKVAFEEKSNSNIWHKRIFFRGGEYRFLNMYRERIEWE